MTNDVQLATADELRELGHGHSLLEEQLTNVTQANMRMSTENVRLRLRVKGLEHTLDVVRAVKQQPSYERRYHLAMGAASVLVFCDMAYAFGRYFGWWG